MTDCPKYMDVVITSDDYNKGYIDALSEVVRLIHNNEMDIYKLNGVLVFAIDKLKKD